MSGGDPFDPFGENDRTIIRPNPGGRAPVPPPTPAPAAAPAPMADAPDVPLSVPGENPLLIAAGPLLDLLGRLRAALTQADFTQLTPAIGRAIEGFERTALAAGADRAEVTTAKYALCAATDDIVQNLPGGEVWAKDPMLGRLFGERIGGTRFFDNLTEAMRNPGATYDLLELKHACLALGFEGMHRASPQGGSDLQRIRREVHGALRGVRGAGSWALSPNWRGMDIAQARARRHIPIWAVAAVLGVLLLGLFLGLRVMLTGETARLTEVMAKVNPSHDIAIARQQFLAAPPPPPPPPPVEDTGQLDRIRTALAAEIGDGLISADYLDANFIIVRMSNRLLFPSGKAAVSAGFKGGLGPRIGAVFAAETDILRQRGFLHGRVIALGHSDAEPLSPASRWGSNQALSKARAQSVLDAVTPHAPADLRTVVEGRGPDDPICTPASDRGCWSENRRVELLIERTQ